MKNFAELYLRVSESNDVEYKRSIIRDYITQVRDDNKKWTIYLLLGLKLKVKLKGEELKEWVIQYTSYPDWLIEQCAEVTHDKIEAYSLMLANKEITDVSDSIPGCIDEILKTDFKNKEKIYSFLKSKWMVYDADTLIVFHKIMTGTHKPLIGLKEISSILSSIYFTSSDLLIFRLSNPDWIEHDFSKLIQPSKSDIENKFEPFQFIKPVVLDDDFQNIQLDEYWLEPYYTGDRIQLHKFDSTLYIWSAENSWVDLLTQDQYKALNQHVPDQSILEGIYLEEENAITWLDIHQWNGKVLHSIYPFDQRKKILMDWLEKIEKNSFQKVSHHIAIELNHLPENTKDWILKHRSAEDIWYRIRPKAKLIHTLILNAEFDPRSTQLVYTITLGVYKDEVNLASIAKINSSQLPASEKTSLYYWIQNNTTQKFGPVRVVRAQQIITISYEKTKINKRVKAGLNLVNVKFIEWHQSMLGKLKVSTLNEIS
mgnify:CR=1 FL=1